MKIFKERAWTWSQFEIIQGLAILRFLKHGRTKIGPNCAKCVAEGGIGAVAGQSWVPGCGKDAQPKPPVAGPGGHQTGF